ncbi:MAG TPA: hypothetical protein VJ817_02495, partial [Gemmatimonadales bacterium]|nr:hypothetical protein [Gemmatimonadales bacterium]
MPRLCRSLLLVVATTLPVSSTLLAQSDRPATGRWQCDTNFGGPTIYATKFFEWAGLAQELQNAFQQHLLASYGYKERVGCRMASPGGPTLAELDADMQRQQAQFRAQGKKIVAVPWTIASPGVTLPYTCFGVAQVRRAGMADSTYLLRSRIFRIQAGNQGELSLSWIDHLKSLHPGWYFQSPGCNLLPADPAGHQEYIDLHVGMYERFKPSVTQLDWQYRPGAAAETAEADKQPAYYCERIGRGGKTVFITPVRPADPSWERVDYQLTWQLYVRDNLDKDAQTGGCEAGTLKQETVARNGRREQYVNQGFTVRDVDWSYTPGARPVPAAVPAQAAPAPPPAAPPAAPPSSAGKPELDRFGRPLPPMAFYCQYLGLARDASGKYPIYQNELFTVASSPGKVQNAWKAYIESTYRPTSQGSPRCAALPNDPAQREAYVKS